MTIYHLYDLETGEYRGSGVSDYAGTPGIGATTVDPGILVTDVFPPIWTGSEWVRNDPDSPKSKAFRLAARLTVDALIKAEELEDDDVATLSALYDPWQPGEQVQVGDLRSWDGTVVECVQAHVTQEGWEPDQVPALWKVHRQTSGDTPDEWVQPTGSHDAYNTGDRVTFQGQVYESTIDGNIWSPADYPQGWQLIE